MFKIQKRIIYAIEAVLDIALNAGVNPVQNVAIAKRQGIPKRYLEQTLQILVKNNILVASRGPRGGYRLAKERRKIKQKQQRRRAAGRHRPRGRGRLRGRRQRRAHRHSRHARHGGPPLLLSSRLGGRRRGLGLGVGAGALF